MKPIVVFALALFLVSGPLAAAEPTASQGAVASSAGVTHVVAKGETMYAIAREFKVSVEAILKANGMADPTKIKVGQSLVIPRVHVVAKGETLFGIAKAAGVSVEDLKTANSLGPGAVIGVGQVLVLPALASSGGTAPKAGTAIASPTAAKTGTEQKPPASSGAPGSTASASPGQKAQDPRTASPEKGDPAAAPFPPLVKTSPKAVDTALAWPCKGEARYLDGKIEGIMFLTDRGMPSKAVAAGKVVSAGPYRGFGQVVFVQSRSGYIYVYAGNDSLSVGMGDQVKAGQEVGKVGFDAKEGRAAAYFFVFREGQSIDPARAPRG